MSATLAVLGREMRAHRRLLVGSALLGLVPLAINLVEGTQGVKGGGAGDTIYMFLFFIVPVSVGILLGATVLASDVSERRLGFYLSRPIPAPALAVGKLVAALAVALLCWALVSGPLALVSGQVKWVPVMMVLTAVATSTMGAHVLSSMTRSRSPLAVLDLAMLVAVVGAFAATLHWLARAGVQSALPLSMVAVLFAGVVVIVVAAIVQVRVGRGDASRGHRALSLTLWPLAAAVLLVFHLWGRWVLGTTPAETGVFADGVAVGPANGPLLFAGGHPARAGFVPVFAMDGGSGRWTRLENPPAELSLGPHGPFFGGPGTDHRALPVFSDDGALAVWLSPTSPFGDPATVGIVRPRAGQPPSYEERPVYGLAAREYTPIPGQPTIKALAVSNAGMVVFSDGTAVEMFDVSAGRVHARASVGDITGAALQGEVVRLFRERAGAVSIMDWAPGAGDPVERVEVKSAGGPRIAVAARDTALVASDPGQRTLLDVATGARRVFTSPDRDRWGAAAILHDGRAAFRLGKDVVIASANDDALVSWAIPPGAHVRTLRETAPGVLAVGLWSPRLDGRRTVLVDATSGASRVDLARLAPAGLVVVNPGRSPLPPDSLGTRLYTDEEGALLVLERDGTRRVLVPARGTR